MEIFLRIDGSNIGPVTIYDVREMLRSGKATPDTMCWVKGMPEWKSLAEFQPLEGDANLRVASAGADEIAISDEEREAAIQTVLVVEKPRPWIRFWARMLDLSIFTSIVTALVAVTGVADPRIITYEPTLVTLIAVPAAWVLIEAALLIYFGTTPGKWVLNIHLRRDDGGRLDLGQALRRSFAVWWRGIGFGIFPLIIIGCALSNLSLSTRGKTPWDIGEELEIKHDRISEWRVVVYLILTLGTGMLVVATAGPPPEDLFQLTR